MTLTIGEDSYVAVADADAYVAKWHGALAAWDEASTEEKERALRIGTRYVNSHKFKIGINWSDPPRPIKDATVEAALKHVQGEELFPDHDGATIKSESSGVGPLAESVTYASSKKPQKVFSVVRALLAPYLVWGTEVKRGMG